MTVVIAGAEERGERGQEGRDQAALFYADDDMIALSDPRWLQGAFNILVGLFDRVGLRTNVGKTVGMVCRPCQAGGESVGGSLRETDNGGGTHLQGSPEGTVSLQGVRG